VESRRNLVGCGCGLAGLALTLTGLAGAYWPVVVGGLYGAGALLTPPDRPARPAVAGPDLSPAALRADFGRLRTYLASLDVPPAAEARAAELTALLDALLDAEETAGDPEALHVLSRAVRRDVPEAFDAYVRTRWWSRLTPGAEPPERHLLRQLGLLADELGRLAAAVREARELRQHIITTELEDRSPAAPGLDPGDGGDGDGGPRS
jgi:hypothetical protein